MALPGVTTLQAVRAVLEQPWMEKNAPSREPIANVFTVSVDDGGMAMKPVTRMPKCVGAVVPGTRRLVSMSMLPASGSLLPLLLKKTPRFPLVPVP
jgi:hypothetical protein